MDVLRLPIYKFQDDDGRWYLTMSRHGNGSRTTRVTIVDDVVTVDALIRLWEDTLEGDNYHSMMEIPASLVKLLRAHAVPEPAILQILWEILTLYGGWIP